MWTDIDSEAHQRAIVSRARKKMLDLVWGEDWAGGKHKYNPPKIPPKIHSQPHRDYCAAENNNVKLRHAQRD